MVIALASPKAKSSQSQFSSRFLSQKELDPDFVDANSLNRRYHYPVRTYLPFRGVFAQVDPILAALVRYSYTSTSPATTVDPTGAEAWGVNVVTTTYGYSLRTEIPFPKGADDMIFVTSEAEYRYECCDGHVVQNHESSSLVEFFPPAGKGQQPSLFYEVPHASQSLAQELCKSHDGLRVYLSFIENIFWLARISAEYRENVAHLPARARAQGQRLHANRKGETPRQALGRSDILSEREVGRSLVITTLERDCCNADDLGKIHLIVKPGPGPTYRDQNAIDADLHPVPPGRAEPEDTYASMVPKGWTKGNLGFEEEPK